MDAISIHDVGVKRPIPAIERFFPDDVLSVGSPIEIEHDIGDIGVMGKLLLMGAVSVHHKNVMGAAAGTIGDACAIGGPCRAYTVYVISGKLAEVTPIGLHDINVVSAILI